MLSLTNTDNRTPKQPHTGSPHKTQQEVKIEIGGVCLLLRMRHPQIKRRVIAHYKNYISSAEPDIFVDVEYGRRYKREPLGDLIFSASAWRLYRGKRGRSIVYFPVGDKSSFAEINHRFNKINFYTCDSRGQTLLYLFPEILFSVFFSRTQALLLHACGVLSGRQGYVFVGPSGSGKSTIAKLALAANRLVLNDDRIIIRKVANAFKVFGTPWHGEVRTACNKNAHITEIFFIRKSSLNHIRAINNKEALSVLLKNSFYLSLNSAIIKKWLILCCTLVGNVRCRRLYFRNDASLWRFLDGLKQENSQKERGLGLAGA